MLLVATIASLTCVTLATPLHRVERYFICFLIAAKYVFSSPNILAHIKYQIHKSRGS